jgi:hypothetical protein
LNSGRTPDKLPVKWSGTIDNHWVDAWLCAISECEGDIANLDDTLSCPR